MQNGTLVIGVVSADVGRAFKVMHKLYKLEPNVLYARSKALVCPTVLYRILLPEELEYIKAGVFDQIILDYSLYYTYIGDILSILKYSCVPLDLKLIDDREILYLCDNAVCDYQDLKVSHTSIAPQIIKLT